MSSLGPYRTAEATSPQRVPAREVIDERAHINLLDDATRLTSEVSAQAVTLAKAASAAARWTTCAKDSPMILSVVDGRELAAMLDDVRQRLMVIAELTSKLASGAKQFEVEIPQ